jgi:hypothetical protein
MAFGSRTGCRDTQYHLETEQYSEWDVDERESSYEMFIRCV